MVSTPRPVPTLVCAFIAALLALTLIVPQPGPWGRAETTDKFAGGGTSSVITFGAGGGEDNGTALLLPADTNVTDSALTVSTVYSPAGEYPKVATLDVGGDGDLEWKFGSTGLGRFGLQDRLSGSQKSDRVIVQGGSNSTLSIRLPKGAEVTNATLNLTGHWNGIPNGDFNAGTTGWTEYDYYSTATMTTSANRGGAYPGTGWGGNGNYILVHSNPLGANQNRCYVEVHSDTFKHEFGDYVTLSWDMVEVDRYYCTLYGGDVQGGWSHMAHIGNPNGDDNINHFQNLTGATYDISDLADVDRFIELMVYSAWDNDGDWGRIAVDDIFLSYADGTPIPQWPNDVGLDLGADGTEEWDMTGLMTAEQHVGGLEDAFNDLLDTMPVSGKDQYGNKYVDIPLNITSPDLGEVGVEDIHIEYDYTAKVWTKPDGTNLTSEVNEHLAALSAGDSRGDVRIPILVTSQSAGKVELGGLFLEYNGAPTFTGLGPSPMTVLEAVEDVSDPKLMDLTQFVQDDSDAFGDITVDPVQDGKWHKVMLVRDGADLGVDLSKATDFHTRPGEPLIFRLIATDTTGMSRVSPDIGLVIRPINDEPEASKPMANITLEEDSPDVKVDLVLGDHFLDVDGDPMYYTALVDPLDEVEGENITAVTTSSGILKVGTAPDFFGSLIPVYVFADDGDDGDGGGEHTVNATVTGGSAYQVIYVNVTPVNDPPVWGPLQDLTLEDGETAEDYLVMAEALTDVDTPPDALVFPDPLVTHPGICTAVVDGEGDLDITAGDGVEGRTTVTLQVVDGEHLVTASFDVRVVRKNTAPALVDPPSQIHIDEDSVSVRGLNLGDIFHDQDGDELTYNITSAGTYVEYYHDTTSDWVHFTPETNWNGEALFTFSATDPEGLGASFNMTVVVDPVNDPPTDPVILSPENGAVFGDETITFEVEEATDLDGDELVYYWDFDVADGVDQRVEGMVVDHSYTRDGVYTVKVTVTDGTVELTDSISLSVADVSEGPGPLDGGDGGTAGGSLAASPETIGVLTIILLVVFAVLVAVFFVVFKKKTDTDKQIKEARSVGSMPASTPSPAITLYGGDSAPRLPRPGVSPGGAGPSTVEDPSLLLPSRPDGGEGAELTRGGSPKVVDAEVTGAGAGDGVPVDAEVTEAGPTPAGTTTAGPRKGPRPAPPEDRDIAAIEQEGGEGAGKPGPDVGPQGEEPSPKPKPRPKTKPRPPGTKKGAPGERVVKGPQKMPPQEAGGMEDDSLGTLPD